MSEELDAVMKQLGDLQEQVGKLSDTIMSLQEQNMDLKGELHEASAAKMYKRDNVALKEQLSIVMGAFKVIVHSDRTGGKAEFDSMLAALAFAHTFYKETGNQCRLEPFFE